MTIFQQGKDEVFNSKGGGQNFFFSRAMGGPNFFARWQRGGQNFFVCTKKKLTSTDHVKNDSSLKEQGADK